ncbi:MAG: hypothetical protein CL674_04010 [Bdellovibrionaceae bacterium]|nr:hypothetical protein [Pseudobdellovibrionaceae bacterium]|tara:strand:- start:50 stop:232 length:183 start_codon:yes stop_codon:yes gene_type:complete
MKWAANTAEIYKKQKEPAKNQTLAQKKNKSSFGRKALKQPPAAKPPHPPAPAKIKINDEI